MLIIRSKIPSSTVLLICLLALSCAVEKKQNKSVLGANEKKITSKLRIKSRHSFTRKIFNKNQTFVEKTKDWLETNIDAQKIYLSDLNGDNKLELITLSEKYSSPKIFEFDQASKKFALTKKDNYFPRGFRASFLVFDDFNKDTLLDVYAGQFYLGVAFNVPPSQIMYGKVIDKNIEFTNELKIFKKGRPQSGVSMLDADRDGFLDFNQVFWLERINGRNHFYPPNIVSAKGEVFEIFTSDNSILSLGASSWSSEICDINSDGLVDILIANTSGHENFVLVARERDDRFFFDSGHKRFKTLTKDSDAHNQLLGNGNTFGYLCGDFNNDGLLDLISYEEKRELQDASRDPIRVHFQMPPTNKSFPFESKPFPIGEKSYSIKNIIDFDMDNDGDLDLIVENSGFPPRSRLMIFKNEGGRFIDITQQSGIDLINPAGTIISDLDGDGKVELLIGQSKVRSASLSGHLKFFEQKSVSNNAVMFFLDGISSNPNAIGAIVTLKTKSNTQTAIVDYGKGIYTQGKRLLHFGLGKDRSFELAVLWPFGRVKKTLYQGSISNGNKFTLCENGKVLPGISLCKR